MTHGCLFSDDRYVLMTFTMDSAIVTLLYLPYGFTLPRMAHRIAMCGVCTVFTIGSSQIRKLCGDA